MRIRGLYVLHAALVLVGAAVVTTWIDAAGGFRVLSGWREWRPEYLASLAAASVTSMGLRFVRWQYLLRRVGVRVPVRSSLWIYLASLVGTATPAYVGEVLRGFLLKRRFAVPLRLSLGTLAFERMLDVLALSLIAMVATPSATTLGLVFVVLLGGTGATLLGLTVGTRMGVPRRLIQRLLAPGPLVRSLVLSIGAWVVAGMLVPIATAAIGHPIGVADGLGIFSTSTLFGAATLMPAGIGSTGSAVILQLQELGLSLANGVTAVTLLRLAGIGLWLTVGIIILAIQLPTLRSPASADAVQHFDDVAATYGDQFSEHVWNHLVERKMDLLVARLPESARASAGGIGLDLGCGLGLQCRAMNARGYRVIGLDASQGLARQALDAGLEVTAGSALALPLRDGSLDFVYAVGMLHHLPGTEEQRDACREIRRVLKPGGRLIVHETNPRNLLFSFYMGYVFPILRTIDDGTEWWVPTRYWDHVDGLRLVGTEYFTFLPDFVPRFLMGVAKRVERFLEGTRARRYSVHYMVVLEKTGDC